MHASGDTRGEILDHARKAGSESHVMLISETIAANAFDDAYPRNKGSKNKKIALKVPSRSQNSRTLRPRSEALTATGSSINIPRGEDGRKK
jgi:hypothetical protein